MLSQSKCRFFLISLFFFLASQQAFAQQDTLQNNYEQLSLKKGIYYVGAVVAVNGAIVVEPGVTILFGTGGTIVCNGEVQFMGSVREKIALKGIDSSWGNGIAIRSKNFQAKVVFQHVQFSNLVLPINFSSGWLRSNVSIKNCVFNNNEGTSSVLQVLNPEITPGDISTKVVFELHQNLFYQNRASIYFEDLSTSSFSLSIANNTFYGNRIPGYGKYSFSSNLIYGRSDKPLNGSVSNFRMTENSFVANQMWDVDADTLIQRANFGVYGNADSVEMPKNFFSNSSDTANSKPGIYDYLYNYTSPKVVVTQNLNTPTQSSPTHFYKIYGDSIELDEEKMYKLPEYGYKSIRLYSNAQMNADKLKVSFHFLKDTLTQNVTDSVLTVVKATIDSSDRQYTLILQVKSDSLFKLYKGYLRVGNVFSMDSTEVPPVYVGQKNFFVDLYQQKLRLERERIFRLDSSISSKKPIPAVVYKFKKKYEVGISAAYAIYYGTLSNKKIFKNDFNSSFGVEFRYSLQNHVAISLGVFKTTLTGSDERSNDSSKIARGMSFKTSVMGFSAQIEFDLVDNRFYSSRTRLRPAIGFGVDYIKFNPMGEYLGKLYNLQPLGTGGQTLDNSTIAPYQLSTLGAPVTAQLRYFLNRRTIFSIFATYHLTFTDYLDDVGPTPYPDLIQVEQKNGDNGKAAAYFSNPTRRVVSPNQLRSGLSTGSDSFLTFGFKLSKHF